jgi:hypothetical protein
LIVQSVLIGDAGFAVGLLEIAATALAPSGLVILLEGAKRRLPFEIVLAIGAVTPTNAVGRDAAERRGSTWMRWDQMEE